MSHVLGCISYKIKILGEQRRTFLSVEGAVSDLLVHDLHNEPRHDPRLLYTVTLIHYKEIKQTNIHRIGNNGLRRLRMLGSLPLFALLELPP